jgi:hypothetical protein
MDPNANLKEQREIVDQIIDALDASTAEDADVWDDERVRDVLADNLARFCDLVQALDGWLSGGGFLPEAWARGRKPLDLLPTHQRADVSSLFDSLHEYLDERQDVHDGADTAAPNQEMVMLQALEAASDTLGL